MRSLVNGLRVAGCAAVLSAVIGLVCLDSLWASPAAGSTPEAKVASELREWVPWDGTITRDDVEALARSRRLLLMLVDQFADPSYFWAIVRQPNRESIPWKTASELIRSGRVAEVTETHSGMVLLRTRKGYTFKSTEPEPNEARRIIDEVDPSRVFVVLVSE